MVHARRSSMSVRSEVEVHRSESPDGDAVGYPFSVADESI